MGEYFEDDFSEKKMNIFSVVLVLLLYHENQSHFESLFWLYHIRVADIRCSLECIIIFF